MLATCAHDDGTSSEQGKRIDGVLATGKDLIIVSIDTLRADRLPFYGGSRANAGDPRQQWSLAWLAANGTLLENAYAHVGITLPSLASLWTGQEPLQHGVLTNRGLVEQPTFAMEMADLGWHGVSMNTSGILRSGAGLERGFDTYKAIKPKFEAELAKRITEKARVTITEGEPLMMWAHYVTPHAPYAPTSEFAGTYTTSPDPPGTNAVVHSVEAGPVGAHTELIAHLRNLYDEEILVTDSYVQDLLSRLDAIYRESGRGGLLDNAVVVFTSDHGEELGDRNSFVQHAKSLYSGVIRVPTLVLGAEWPAQRDARMLGLKDLLPWVIHGTEPTDRYVVSALKDRFFAIRDSRWTLVHNPMDDMSGPGGLPPGSEYPYPTVALFDHIKDPLEMVDLAAQHPKEVERLLDELRAWFDAVERSKAQALNQVIDDETLNELGYAADEGEQPATTPPPWTGSDWRGR